MADGGQAIDHVQVIELAARRLARALGYGGGFLADSREEAERNAESTRGIGHFSIVKRGRAVEQAAKSIHGSTRVRRQHEWKQLAGVVAIPVARPDQDALAALSFAKLGGPLEAMLLLYATGDVPRYWPTVKRFGMAVQSMQFAEEALTDAMQRILCGRAALAKDMRAKALRIRADRYRRLTSDCEDLLASWLWRASCRFLGAYGQLLISIYGASFLKPSSCAMSADIESTASSIPSLGRKYTLPTAIGVEGRPALRYSSPAAVPGHARQTKFNKADEVQIMGGGGTPKNTTTTTKTELPPWLSNAYTQFFNQTNQVNSKPYYSYGGQLNADLSSGQQQAIANAQQGAAGNPWQQGALNGVLLGGYNVSPVNNQYLGATTQVGTNAYAGPNPALQGMIDKSNTDITHQFQNSQANLAAQFATNGAFGGSAMQQAVNDQNRTLADALTNSENQYRFQDYSTQQQLAESALNRSVQAQQTDLARNSALAQQQFQNQLNAAGQNAQNILGASSQINGTSALQAQFNGQLAGLGQVQQDYNQGNIDQAYNDWYMRNYGYDQQRLANFGNALNSVAGQFQGTATTGMNPAYKPRTAGGAIASGASGAAAGSAIGSMMAGAQAGSAGSYWGAGIGALAGLASYYL